jgi:hypothetical protein
VWILKPRRQPQIEGRTVRSNDKGNGKRITIPALEYGKPERCTDIMELLTGDKQSRIEMDTGEQTRRRLSYLDSGATDEEESATSFLRTCLWSDT